METSCANPLLLSFLKKWWDEAKERTAKSATIYKKAYESMKACPLTFNHPSEAQQLHGLGPKLCDRLTERLKAHCSANGLPMPKVSRKSRKRLSADDLSLVNPEPPAKKSRKPRPYVPALRSGPYAIILALSTIAESSTAGLTKVQLLVEAQVHCDASFTAPADTSKYYTAWDSMKTLRGKDLVYVKGKPLARYYLTDEGWEVAKRIKTVQFGDGIPSTSLETRENPADNMNITRSIASPADDFDDLTDIPLPVPRRLSIVPEFEQASSTGSGQRLGGAVTDRFGTFSETRMRALPPKKDIVEIFSSPEPYLQPEDIVVRKRQSLIDKSFLIGLYSEKKSSEKALEQLYQDSHSPQRHASLTNFQPIQLQPGTFTVQLVIDSREVRAKNDRDYIQDELVKKGVNVIVRPLELGDFLWVAKCNEVGLLARYDEEGDEVALDWIVERKRLDDLVGSIKDGRFLEQKFRLRKSGATNVVYIIEEFTMSSEKTTTYYEAIESAIASTQVVDGYFVKKTVKLDDTIRYLARMTVMLKGIYESKPIYIIPTAHLEAQTYLPLLEGLRFVNPRISYNITYAAFAALVSKSDFLTVRDVFLKMLMCTRGITGDKALELQKIWKTPRALFEALEACGGKKEREDMLNARLGRNLRRKKIGKTVCAKVAEIWGDGSSESVPAE